MAERREVSAFERRRLLQGLGALGLGSLTVGSSSVAAQLGVPSSSDRVQTAVRDYGGGVALISTGPVRAFAAQPGARIGLCLLCGGSQTGPEARPLIRRIERAEASISGVGPLSSDRGVEQAAYRLLPGLDTVRPVELFGLSARVEERLSGDDTFQVTWEAELQGDAEPASLQHYLDRFHAFIVGRIAEAGSFSGHLSYVEVSQRSEEDSQPSDPQRPDIP